MSRLDADLLGQVDAEQLNGQDLGQRYPNCRYIRHFDLPFLRVWANPKSICLVNSQIFQQAGVQFARFRWTCENQGAQL